MKTTITPSAHDALTYVGVRIPDPIVTYIDRQARRRFRSRSEMIRTLIIDALRARGAILPEDADAA